MATKSRPSFNSTSFLAKVGEGRSMGKYGKSQVVFSQGDAADAVFYVHKGKVKITVVSEQGKEAVVAILGKGDFFGEGCLAGQVQRVSTATSMTDSVIARIEKAAIIRVIHQNHRSPRCSLPIFWIGPSVSKRIWSINCSIRVRNALPECSYCWRTSARKANQNRLSPRSVRKL
jgi:CRP-like cAMP-binding protein